MDDFDFKQDVALVKELRNGLDESLETAVVAPDMPLSQRLGINHGDMRRYRILIVRGLVAFMALLIIGQLAYRGVTAVAPRNDGPVPLQAAVQQIETDLLLPVAPPLP